MVNFRAVCGCCTRTDIVKEHLDSGGHSKDSSPVIFKGLGNKNKGKAIKAELT